jgi:hypothetical protein
MGIVTKYHSDNSASLILTKIFSYKLIRYSYRAEMNVA